MTTPLANATSCPTCAFLSLQLPSDPAITRTARVEELLRRNDPPLEAELADFRLIVEKSPDIIHDLDQKIAQAQELIDRLIRTRAQAESYLADAKSLLHPIRSLPNEILAEIFSNCVWTWETSHWRAMPLLKSIDPSSAPWTLASVCRRWRHLALALPRLWTYIHIHVDSFPDDVTPRQLAFKMALFIERSQGLPLSVFIFSSSDIEDHSIIPILEASIPRWKHFSTNASLQSLHSWFSGNVFSRLKHLVQVIGHDDDSDIILDIFNPTNAPALRSLDADLDPSFFSRVSLPLNLLTHLNDFPIVDGALELLQTMSSLVSLDAEAWRAPSEDIHLSLPRLLRLSVTMTAGQAEVALDKLFSNVDMPSLCDLSFDFYLAPDKRLHFPILNPNRAEKLTKLHISCGMRQHSDVMQDILPFLLQTPHVENFRISKSSLTPEFISGLTTSSRLPRLRVLDMSDNECSDSLAQNMSVIYDMLETRCLHNVHSISSDSHTPTANAMDVGIQPTSLQEASYPSQVRLERIRVPRWLYFKSDERWKVICRSLKVECGITMKDVD